VFNNATAQTYSGVISSTGAVTKSGAGKLILNNANLYSGLTTLTAGTLQVGDGTTSRCFDTLGVNYSGQSIPIDNFNTACWDDSGTYLSSGTPIQNVEIVVPSGTSAVTLGDCLLDISLG